MNTQWFEYQYETTSMPPHCEYAMVQGKPWTLLPRQFTINQGPQDLQPALGTIGASFGGSWGKLGPVGGFGVWRLPVEGAPIQRRTLKPGTHAEDNLVIVVLI